MVERTWTTSENTGAKTEGNIRETAGNGAAHGRNAASQAAGSTQDAVESIKNVADRWGGGLAEFAKDRPIAAMLLAVSTGLALHWLTQTRRA